MSTLLGYPSHSLSLTDIVLSKHRINGRRLGDVRALDVSVTLGQGVRQDDHSSRIRRVRYTTSASSTPKVHLKLTLGDGANTTLGHNNVLYPSDFAFLSHGFGSRYLGSVETALWRRSFDVLLDGRHDGLIVLIRSEAVNRRGSIDSVGV